MYLKKTKKTTKTTNNNQLSLNLNNKLEILQYKSKVKTELEVKDREDSFPRPETSVEKPVVIPNPLKDQEPDTNRPVLGKRPSPKTPGDNNSDNQKLEAKVEAITNNDVPLPIVKGISIELDEKPVNPVSEVIRELSIDLRHKRLIGNADWSESSTVDLEHFNYSADYSAFLSSYE